MISQEEIIDSHSPGYAKESRAWAVQMDLQPDLVLRPTSLSSLQKVVKYLCASDLDFGVRSGGVGSSSGRNIVLSLSAFDQFEFDAVDETVIVGAGQTWGDLDRKIGKQAPGFALVGARCPYVGVAGSILSGGFSWLSYEFGLMSDPQNMLDAQIVLNDGRVVWASEEPDLLWALRGGGGNFGVVIAFKLRARRYPMAILSGFSIIPRASLDAVSRAISEFCTRARDPKVAMHVYSLVPGNPVFPETNGIGLMIYDANGGEHGRGKDGFQWAFEIEGATDMTKVMTLHEVHQLTASGEHARGLLKVWFSGALVSTVDPEFLIRASSWLEKALATNKTLGAGTFVLLETMQEGALNSSGGLTATSWPHAFHRHILQLRTGFLPGSDRSDELSIRLLQESTKEIIGVEEADFFPNFFMPFMDASKIYGDHYPKLQELKTKYDPKGRFNKGIFISPLA